MAQAGFTPISLYFSSTAAAVPTSGNLANGELALNIADMKLYAKNSSGVVTLLASNAATTPTTPGGSTTQVQFNSSGTFAGSANMTFNGTTLTVADLTDSSLTATRVVYAGTAGNLTNSANLTFDGNMLALGSSGNVARFGDGTNTVDIRWRGPNNWSQQLDTTLDIMNFQRNSISLVTITSGGNFGVGTTSPAAVTGFSSSRVVAQVTSSGGFGQLRLGGDAGTMFDHDNSGTTITTIRNLYGATSASALVQIQSGYVTIGTGTSYTERLRIASTGAFGLSGANYGTAGQVLTSGGASAAPTWAVAGGGTTMLFSAFSSTGESYLSGQGF